MTEATQQTEGIQQAGNERNWKDKKLADQTARETKFNKSTVVSDHAYYSQASDFPKKWVPVPLPHGMTKEEQQANIRQYWEDKKLGKETQFDKYTRDYPKDAVPFYLPEKCVSVPIPPGMTLELREANLRQYWEDKKLADETAKNIKLNKNITISIQADHSQALSTLDKGVEASMPSTTAEATQQAGNRQYWEDKKLVDQAAQNTKVDKHVKCKLIILYC